MGTEEKRDSPAVRIVPPVVPLVTVLAGYGFDRLWPIDPGFAISSPAHYWIGGLIVAGAVLGLGLWPVVLFRRSGENELPWTPTNAILERGPYRLTRNPMYLMMVLACIGMAIILWNVWIVILTPVCALILNQFAIKPEEAYLERTFGESYRAYKRRVRRWI